MTPDYEALEKLARAATPWTSEDCCAMFDPSPNGPDQYRVGPNTYDCEKYTNGTGEISPQASRDERFVAHANPTAVLSLISDLRLAMRRIERLREHLRSGCECGVTFRCWMHGVLDEDNTLEKGTP